MKRCEEQQSKVLRNCRYGKGTLQQGIAQTETFEPQTWGCKTTACISNRLKVFKWDHNFVQQDHPYAFPRSEEESPVLLFQVKQNPGMFLLLIRTDMKTSVEDSWGNRHSPLSLIHEPHEKHRQTLVLNLSDDFHFYC